MHGKARLSLSNLLADAVALLCSTHLKDSARHGIPIDVPHLGYYDIDEAQAAVYDKWASDLLDIGVGAKIFKVPKRMIVKGHGLEADD
eukprot:3572-Chlamydomonas_euryale.AAC.1